MLTTLLSSFGGYIVAALAAVTALAGVYFGGKAKGRAAERVEHHAKINEQAAQARQEAQEVRNETAAMADYAIAAELESNWVRKSAGDSQRRLL